MSVYKGKREDAIDNYGDSRSQRHRTGASDRESASARSRHRDCDWEGARNRDRGQDHDIRHRERRVRERARDRSNDDYYRGQEYDRERDYGRHGEESDRNRSRSREDGLGKLPVLLSGSRCKRKRVSGFDMAPPSTWMPGATSLPGHGNGTASAVPGMFPNIFPSVPAQVQAMTHQATRYARRVYVGGLPPSVNEQSIATFFNHVMSAIGGNTAGPGDAVVNVYINREKKFAFVEMRSVEEASNAIALDGIIFEGAAVKVGRPADYSPSSAATLGPTQPNPNLNLGAVGLTLGSAGGFQGPDRIFVGGIPYYFTEVQIRELLLSFGPLLAFNLVKDRETGNSRGYAFCVYEDLSVTDMACAALNGLKLGDKTLTVRRTKQGEQALQQIDLLKLMLQGGTMATKVLCLKQVLTTDMLKEDGEYELILEDMRMECGKFGALVNLVIPRPSPKGEPSQGVGKIFVEYADTDSAVKAREGLNGRKFDGNKVVALFYPENKFFQGDYDA